MIVLVGGSVRSGKSAFALRRARELGERRVFIATAEAGDDEMQARIDAHRSERGESFRTIEAARDLASALRSVADADVAVIDCLTMFVSRRLLSGDDDAAIDAAVRGVRDGCRDARCHTVVVTNEVGLGVVPAHPLGRRFRDAAGRAHQLFVGTADEVYFGVLGLMVRLVPEPVAVVGGTS